MNLFLSTLTDQQRRLYLGLESKRLGALADQQLALITGATTALIGSGQREIHQAQLAGKVPMSIEEAYKIKVAMANRPLTKNRLPYPWAFQPHPLGERTQ
jgi:hypothetical protein